MAHGDLSRQTSEEGLLRTIGTFGMVATVMNQIIGGSIFILPATVAAGLGRAASLAYLVAATVIAVVTTCFVRASRHVATSGGVYGYAEVAFGPYVGFVAGVLLWITGALGSAGVAVALVGSAATALPVLTQPLLRDGAIVVLYLGFITINLASVRVAIRFIGMAAAAKLLTLAIFVVAGAFLVRSDNLTWQNPPSFAALGRLSLLLIFSLSGMENALGPSGEVRDPSRTIPRALTVSIIVIVGLYVTVQLVAQGVLGAALPASSAPLADALSRFGSAGSTLILIGGAISMLGFLAGELLGDSRILFAFGRRGILPRYFAKVAPVSRVPHVAVVAHASVACGLALSGTFVELAVLASIGTVLLYLICCAAAYVLEARQGQTKPGQFRLSQAWVPGLAILCLGWMLTQATRAELVGAIVTVGVATAGYGVLRATGRTPLRTIGEPD